MTHNTPRVSSLYVHNVNKIKITTDKHNCCVRIELFAEDFGLSGDIVLFADKSFDGVMPEVIFATYEKREAA